MALLRGKVGPLLRVLVTKPYNKTLYELLHGRLPSIGFMRPFGCPVTILNTLDPLGKFQGKVDEGFLIGYSVCSKAFRVFNSRTRIVQETLHSLQRIKLTLMQNNNKDALVNGKEHDIQNSVSPNIHSSSSGAQTRKQGDKTKNKDKYDVGAEAGINNLESIISVSPIPTTKIHKDHLTSQIIGDLSSTTQTRSMARVVRDQGGISQMFNEDFHTCMFACFISQEEPNEPIKLSRIQRAMVTKWVYRNKKDERGIVIRNKARLVAQGDTQEEGIEYEEVFAPIARIEAIRLFLAYASFMGFLVYQMDVKSAFLYSTIEEEVYVYQPLGFEDPKNPDKVYKVVKALYELHQAPRAWYETLATYLLENGFHRGIIDQTLFIKKQQKDILLVQIYVDDIIFGLQIKQKKDGIFISQDKYVAEILKKFGLSEGKLSSTPIDAEKPLLKDSDGEVVDPRWENDPGKHGAAPDSLRASLGLQPGKTFVLLRIY
nr:retrovirus-related Pol polyprotein from transposon TNT 1-94 [Tanacetum cinerariifolium]